MTDKTSFKKTLFLFKREASTLMNSDWRESPNPFKRFLDSIERESDIKSYLDDCVFNHTPDGFNAAEEVEAVADDPDVVFDSFSTIPEEESAGVYLILKELIAQDIKGRSDFFLGFTYGKKYSDMYKGFLNKVAYRLIANIDTHLTLMGIDMGLGGTDSVVNNIVGPVQNLQLTQANGNATVNAVLANGIDAAGINSLLNDLLTAAETEVTDRESLQDIRECVGSIRSEMESDEPRPNVLRKTLTFLRGVSGGTQFAAALTQVISFVNSLGFQFPLPS